MAAFFIQYCLGLGLGLVSHHQSIFNCFGCVLRHASRRVELVCCLPSCSSPESAECPTYVCYTEDVQGMNEEHNLV